MTDSSRPATVRVLVSTLDDFELHEVEMERGESGSILAALQRAVGGTVEAYAVPAIPDVLLYVGDEFLLADEAIGWNEVLTRTGWALGGAHSEIGSAGVFVGADAVGSGVASLTDEQVVRIRDAFEQQKRGLLSPQTNGGFILTHHWPPMLREFTRLDGLPESGLGSQHASLYQLSDAVVAWVDAEANAGTERPNLTAALTVIGLGGPKTQLFGEVVFTGLTPSREARPLTEAQVEAVKRAFDRAVLSLRNILDGDDLDAAADLRKRLGLTR